MDGTRVLPVDPSRPFLRLDVDVIVIDVNLGNLHLEVVGKEPDGFPHRAEAGTPWRLKQRGGSRRAWGEQRRKSEAVIITTITKAGVKKVLNRNKGAGGWSRANVGLRPVRAALTSDPGGQEEACQTRTSNYPPTIPHPTQTQGWAPPAKTKTLRSQTDCGRAIWSALHAAVITVTHHMITQAANI